MPSKKQNENIGLYNWNNHKKYVPRPYKIVLTSRNIGFEFDTSLTSCPGNHPLVREWKKIL